MHRIVFFFGLIAIALGFQSSCKPGNSIAGKYESEPAGVKLVLKKNGAFRYTFSHIRRHTENGKWLMKGDTLVLDFDSDSTEHRLVWDKECLLKNADGSSAFVDVKCR
jgi:hypothetical protein